MKRYLLLLLSPLLFAMAEGSPAPEFTAQNQDGKEIRLSSLRGHYVLLYFYPKDDSAGCTMEAQGFRGKIAQFKKLNAVVLGVSRQDAASHKLFAEKNTLPFDLLVDTDGAVGKSYGIPTRQFVGTYERQSVLIGPDGNVLRVYAPVDPRKHAEEVEADIKSARKAAGKKKS